MADNSLSNAATAAIDDSAFRRVTRSMTRYAGGEPIDYGIPSITKRKAMDLNVTSPVARKRQKSVLDARPKTRRIIPQSLRFPKKMSQTGKAKVKAKVKQAASVPTPSQPDRLHCAVCDTERPLISFDHASPCVVPHVPTVCRSCLAVQLRASLDQGLLKQICCPGCQSEWDNMYLCKFFSDEDMKKYRQLAVDHPKYVKCLRPGCRQGQVHPPGLRSPQVICEKCGFEHCFGHRVPWHSEMTCAEYHDHIMKTFEEEDEKNGRNINSDRTQPASDPGSPIKSERRCPTCGKNPFNVPSNPSVLHCGDCNRDACTECLADMKQINEHGAHHHRRFCRFWAHQGWDTTGDVRRGVASITLQREQLQKAQQQHQKATQMAMQQSQPQQTHVQPAQLQLVPPMQPLHSVGSFFSHTAIPYLPPPPHPAGHMPSQFPNSPALPPPYHGSFAEHYLPSTSATAGHAVPASGPSTNPGKTSIPVPSFPVFSNFFGPQISGSITQPPHFSSANYPPYAGATYKAPGPQQQQQQQQPHNYPTTSAVGLGLSAPSLFNPMQSSSTGPSTAVAPPKPGSKSKPAPKYPSKGSTYTPIHKPSYPPLIEPDPANGYEPFGDIPNDVNTEAEFSGDFDKDLLE